MNKKQQKLVQTHADLFSIDDNVISKALVELVKSGNETSIIPLIEFYASTENDQYKKISEKLLMSLKTKNAASYLIEALENPRHADHKAFILSIFWNAGIPPHEHIHELVDEAVHGDFLVAFEVLTIIEIIDGNIDPVILENAIAKTTDYLDTSGDGEKTTLITSIHQILIDFADAQFKESTKEEDYN